jgi:hypothetical protein
MKCLYKGTEGVIQYDAMCEMSGKVRCLIFSNAMSGGNNWSTGHDLLYQQNLHIYWRRIEHRACVVCLPMPCSLMLMHRWISLHSTHPQWMLTGCAQYARSSLVSIATSGGTCASEAEPPIRITTFHHERQRTTRRPDVLACGFHRSAELHHDMPNPNSNGRSKTMYVAQDQHA